ncbi:12207_t:CDS:2, partial [Acaulospora colombiana]
KMNKYPSIPRRPSSSSLAPLPQLESCLPTTGRECSSLPPDVKPIAFTLTNCTLQGHGQVPDVLSWGLQVTLGSTAPGSLPQEMCLMTSTFTNNTFIPTVKACSTDNTTQFATCATRRGGLFDSSGSSLTAISSASDLPPDVNWAAIDPGNSVTEKGTIPLQLPSEISLPQFPFKTIEGGQNHNTGHLGLGRSSPLLQQLSDEKGIVAGFGLDAGSQSQSPPRDGHLILGGYDRQKVGSSVKDYNVTHSQTSGRICSLQVTITELVLQRPGLEDTVLISRGQQMEACIEPYDTLFRFPQTTLNAFAEATNFVNGSLPDPSQFYIVEPGLTYPSSPAFNGSLKITLDYDFVVEIPTEELAHPLRGISPTGERVTMSNTTELNIFRQVALLDTAVLGKAFLSRVYLMVQYRSTGAVFRLAKSNQGELPIYPVAFDPDCTNSKRKLSKGAIAGIVIGSLVGAVLIALLVRLLYRRANRLPQQGPAWNKQ